MTAPQESLSGESVTSAADRPVRVAIVGAGPAGVYVADVLMKSGTDVSIDLFERQPAPYGLIRYGVAPDHPRIKGIIKALRQVLSKPQVRLLGNVEYGVDVKLDDLREHYDAVVFTTGAEKDRELDIPGIDLPGSFGGAEFVSWFDGHPDVPRTWPLEAEKIAVIGAGNVGLDVARMLSKTADELLATEIPDNVYQGLKASPVKEVHVFARRGPAQAKFTPLELRELDHSPNVEVLMAPEDFELDGGSVSSVNSDNQTKLVVRELERYAMRTAEYQEQGSGDGRAAAQAVAALLREPGRGLRRRQGRGLPHRAHRADRRRQRPRHGRVPRLAGAGGVPLRGLPQHRAGRSALEQPRPRRAARRRSGARPRRRAPARPVRQRLGQARPGGPDRAHQGRRHRDRRQPAGGPRPRAACRVRPARSPRPCWSCSTRAACTSPPGRAGTCSTPTRSASVSRTGGPRIKVVERETMIEVSRAVAKARAEGDEAGVEAALEHFDEVVLESDGAPEGTAG